MIRFLAIGFVMASAAAGAHAGGRPNIVLMMADDLGWGDTGFNGNTVIRTPQLDRMAANGLVLDRFYAASAVCSPTRGSCLTGRHPQRLGIPTANAGHLRAEEITLAEMLRDAGYATGHFGKWHLGTLTKTVRDSNRGGPGGTEHFSPPWNHGFEVCFSTEAKVPTFDPMLIPTGKASQHGWDFIHDKSAAQPYGTRYWNERGGEVTENLAGDDSRVIMDRVIPFVEKAASGKKPFFAVLWFHTPHMPVVAGPDHVKPYAEYDVYRRNYYGCISAMDEQVGRLRETLRKAGVAENTLLCFASDNGPEGKAGRAPGSAGPFHGRKRDLYEGGIRVPAMIEWPARVKPGRRSGFPAVTSDYLPTVLDIIGKPLPEKRVIDGVSLLPLIDGKADERASPIGFAFGKQSALSD
ncbi:MAG TPA: sulfatase-like hydrolase/transferase, partial [Luteolibacter sp.]|nr:sulfatase-like hydrolase/transferase [Luteolibacter sp.]